MNSAVDLEFRHHHLEWEEAALSQYFQEVHGVSVEDLLKVSDNVNNFKLKHFKKMTYPKQTDYLFKDEVFLSVVRGDFGSCDIHMLWKDTPAVENSLIKHLQKSSKIVEGWPSWKRG